MGEGRQEAVIQRGKTKPELKLPLSKLQGVACFKFTFLVCHSRAGHFWLFYFHIFLIKFPRVWETFSRVPCTQLYSVGLKCTEKKENKSNSLL